jgi:hypothetical protein
VGSRGVEIAKAPKKFQKPCETCGKLIWAYPSQVALGMKRYCSRACKPGHPGGPDSPSWKGGRSVGRNGYVRIHAADGLHILEHRVILLAKIGPGTHPCHWCGAPVTWTKGMRLGPGVLVTDHVDWDKTNNDPANLVPACQPCNVTRPRAS